MKSTVDKEELRKKLKDKLALKKLGRSKLEEKNKELFRQAQKLGVNKEQFEELKENLIKQMK